MSNNVARNVTPQLWHTVAQYRWPVDVVRKLEAGDITAWSREWRSDLPPTPR